MEQYSRQCLQIGEMAPSFTAKTTNGIIHFPEDYKGKWVVFFSHPADFTPVCTTEFMTFQSMYNEFKNVNTELIGLSIDSITSHIAWLRNIQNLSWNGINKPQIKFPVIADLGMEVARKFGMIHPAASDTQTVRSVFIIDPVGKIRAILSYPLTNGRNIKEILRLVLALQKTDLDKVATPANWQPGDEVILFPPQTMQEAEERINDQKAGGYHCLDWTLCFKNADARAK